MSAATVSEAKRKSYNEKRQRKKHPGTTSTILSSSTSSSTAVSTTVSTKLSTIQTIRCTNNRIIYLHSGFFSRLSVLTAN